MPIICYQNKIISFRLRRSSRVRHLQMRWLNHEAQLIAPIKVDNYQVQRFLWQHQAWLHKQACRYPKREYPLHQLLYQDKWFEFELSRNKASKIEFDLSRFYLGYVQSKNLLIHLRAWYQQQASAQIHHLIQMYAPKLGLWPAQIKLRYQKTRWGSCNQLGQLSFNWSLILAPPAVLAYVVVHELCHLRHLNHSKAFWLLVAKLCPDFKQAKYWLKNQGYTLHQYLLTLEQRWV